ncbi:MAG: hypothetical protein EBU31_11920, partial [Proteobacteria bacterium]|nr:hypothetical protein [Pseudomonadota bacterium]
ILVVTATVEGNATRVYEAIGAGALDAVDTPRLGADGTHGAKALVSKVEVIRRMAKAEAPRGATAIAPARPRPQVDPMVPAAGAPAAEAAAPAGAPIIAVGSSTGGPQALATFLKSLPNPLPYAVVIVQHMDVTFLPGLATWLSGQTGLNVELAPRHGRPTAGSVMVAGQDLQMVLKQNGTLDYVAGDPDLIHRPSVDVFFESLAKSRTQTGAAVMLTGMGRDGAAGMKAGPGDQHRLGHARSGRPGGRRRTSTSPRSDRPGGAQRAQAATCRRNPMSNSNQHPGAAR